MSLSDEDAGGIALRVLHRHGLALPKELSLIANGLAIASDEEFFIVNWYRESADERKRRAAKIDLLKQVAESYRVDKHQVEIRSSEGVFPSEAHYWMRARHNMDLDDLLAGVETLLETEQFIGDRTPAISPPTNRPTTAKNAGAACIFEVLNEMNVDAWAACAVIADMFAEAGIGSGDQKKEQRALYDKLSRLVR